MANPETDAELQARIDAAIAKIRQEKPDVATYPIAPMGMLDRLGKKIRDFTEGGSTQAFTGPKDISYSLETLRGQTNDQLESLFSHELTHAQDFQGRAKGELFEAPTELHGYSDEDQRNLRLHRPIDPHPALYPNQKIPTDIQLPRQKLPGMSELLPGSDQNVIQANIKMLKAKGYPEMFATQTALNNAKVGQ